MSAAFAGLPRWLFEEGPLKLAYWQWLALPCLIAVAVGCALLLTRLTRRVLSRVTARTAFEWDDRLLDRIGGPLTALWAAGICSFALPWLNLQGPLETVLPSVFRLAFFFGIFWLLLRSTDIAADAATRSTWAQTYPASRSLVPLGSRVLKVMLLAMGVVSILAALGYPVASLIAGLGIGGLALALAAQKTVENLFGAFSIGVDQPLREGDFVKVEEVLGTVETIGLRSTRIRSLDRTLITIPNGKLAEMKIESFAVRDRIRLSCKLGLVYGTTGEQMRAILSGLEAVLRKHEKIWPEVVQVHFVGYSDSSLDIEVMAWFETRDFNEFLRFRQEILLEFMTVVETAGSAFAFPTRSVHVKALPG